jgi:serine/threonine protein kinase
VGKHYPACQDHLKNSDMSSGSLARRRRIDDHMILVRDEIVQGHHGYTVDRLVGSGAYAAVYRAKDDMGRWVALKEYFPAVHPREVQQLRLLWERERYVLTQVSPHPLMPTFYEAFEYNNQLYIAQEYVEGGTLAEIIQRYKKLDPDWMLKWAVNLCDALTFLHERCIVHHDLKPANLKITPEGHLFLLDYGAAQFFGEQRDDVPEAFLAESELYGTEGYLPPELDETFAADVQTDIFALGCILYEMVMGVPPEQQRLNERNCAVTTPLTRRRDVDMAYVKLVTTALSYNTEYRYASAQMFLQELRKISPAVPMVSAKNLYFGTVNYNQATATQHFLIYNSGPQVEITGDIISRVPWLKVEVPHFQGRRRDVAVVCTPKRATLFNTPMKGDIEIHIAETRNQHGEVVIRADKWVVHCFGTIEAAAPRIEVKSIAEPDQRLVVKAMKGVTGKLRVSVANHGEVPAEFVLQARDPEIGLRSSHNTLRLEGREVMDVELQFRPGRGVEFGTFETDLIALVRDREIMSVPVTLQVLSPVEYAKTALRRS